MTTHDSARAEAFKPLKIHRNEETIHGGLASADIVPVEDPIVSILAWKRNLDRDLPIIPVDHIIIVGDSMDLIRPKMVDIFRSATGFLDPSRHNLSVRPNIMCFALTAIHNKRNNR
jgi:hypothetical protein